MSGSAKFLMSLITVLVLFLLTGCGEDKQPEKSMEQVQMEEGLPVRVEEVKTQTFEKYLSFYSNLSGIKEATKGAMIGGRITRVNANVGDFVQENKVIVEFASDNPAVMIDQARTAYENSKKTYERMKALLDAGETSQANFDGAEAQYLVNKRNYETQKQLLYIDAPFGGIVTDIKVKPGDNVKGEAPLFTVALLNKMRTKIWVTEKEIVQFRKGMVATINYLGKEYQGRVVDIALSADPYKQAFYVEIEFDNGKRELRSGVTVEVRVLTYSNPNAIIVKRNLVREDDKGMFVFLEKNGHAAKRYISNGMDSGIDCEVKTGLSSGDRLIVTGGAQLEEGRKVKVIN